MADWIDELDDEGREQWEEFVAHVRRTTVEGMTDSAYVVSLVPKKDGVDVKYAVELGLSIMLEKPILVVAFPDSHVPEKLKMIADEVVYADIDTESGQKALMIAITRMNERLPHG